MCLESFKTDELQQISDISGRKPVLLGARHLHPDPFGKGNERLPKMVVSCNQHTSMSLAKRRQIAQSLKHIHRIADINAFAITWPDNRQEIAGAAANR